MRWTLKQPLETRIIPIDYTGRIPSGITLVSGTVSAINKATGADVTGTIVVSATAVISVPNDTASCVIIAGTANTDYKVTMRILLSNAEIVEDDITVLVRDL